MAATFIQSDGGPKLMHFCETCGKWGSFGYGADLRRAMKTKNQRLAGRWFCAQHRPENKQ